MKQVTSETDTNLSPVCCQYTECSSEKLKLEQLVTSLEQELAEKYVVGRLCCWGNEVPSVPPCRVACSTQSCEPLLHLQCGDSPTVHVHGPNSSMA